MAQSRAATLNGRLGAARRYHPEADHSALEREAKVANLEEYLDRVMTEPPVLTPADRAELARFIERTTTGGH